MTYVIAAAVGLVWGIAIGYLNFRITKHYLKKGDTNKLLGTNMLKTLIDACAIGVIFLARNILPFDPSVCMIATAIALSITTIVLLFQLTKEQ